MKEMMKDKHPLVFLDVSIDGRSSEKMVFELFFYDVPNAAENFRTLCTGEEGMSVKYKKPLHFKGSSFHRIIKGHMALGGDFVKGDGTCGESIYGSRFPCEQSCRTHDEPGLLSLSKYHRRCLGSHFILTFKRNHFLDRHFTVFGKLVHGYDVLKKIEEVGDEPVENNDEAVKEGVAKVRQEAAPVKKDSVVVKITDSGEFREDIKKFKNMQIRKDASVDSDSNSYNSSSSNDRCKRRKRSDRDTYRRGERDKQCKQKCRSRDNRSRRSKSASFDSDSDSYNSYSSDGRCRSRKRYDRDTYRRGERDKQCEQKCRRSRQSSKVVLDSFTDAGSESGIDDRWQAGNQSPWFEEIEAATVYQNGKAADKNEEY